MREVFGEQLCAAKFTGSLDDRSTPIPHVEPSPRLDGSADDRNRHVLNGEPGECLDQIRGLLMREGIWSRSAGGLTVELLQHLRGQADAVRPEEFSCSSRLRVFGWIGRDRIQQNARVNEGHVRAPRLDSDDRQHGIR